MSMELDFIDNVPFLESDYPLFSWDEFPQSKNALERGKPVALFETVCWNKLVMNVDSLRDELGYTWSAAPYFFSGESKVFTANMYKEMCSAMNILFPIYKEEYKSRYMPQRGDELTVGHLTFVEKCLNKILRTARGTDGLARIWVSQSSGISTIVQAMVQPAFPITGEVFDENIFRTVTDIKIDVLPSVPVSILHTGNTTALAAALTLERRVLEPENFSKTHFRVVPEKLLSAPGAASVIGRTNSSAKILLTYAKEKMDIQNASQSFQNVQVCTPEIIQTSAGWTAFSNFQTKMAAIPYVRTGAASINFSNVAAVADTLSGVLLEGLPVIGKSVILSDLSCKGAVIPEMINHLANSILYADFLSLRSAAAYFAITGRSFPDVSVQTPASAPAQVVHRTFTKQHGSAITRTARPTWADGKSVSTGKAKADLLPAVNLTVHESGAADTACTLELLESADIGANTLAFGSTECQAAIWLLPLQPDRKTLHIRQTYKEAIKIGNTLYIDEWPEQGLTDDGTLWLWKLYDTVMQVGNTLYIGSMPNTGMTDGRTLLIWDVEQEPVKKNTLLEVF